MGRMAPLTTLKPLSEINLTPLMDLTFILLITFIITFPLIEQGVPIELPQAAAGPLRADTARSVSLDRAGAIFLDDRPLAFDALQERLSLLAQTEPNVTIYVRADKTVAYGEVVRILQALHDAKLTRIALVTRGDPKAAGTR